MNKRIKQHDYTDCGAACLASVAAHYGLELPIARIRQYASTDKKGTNILGLIEAADKLGFSAKGVKSLNPDGTQNFAPLTKIPLPTIAHVVVNHKLLHYVVIQDAKIAADRLFEIMDLEREDEGQKITLQPNQVGDIEFANVSFRYGSRGDVFDNFSIRFPKGEISAVVGESGSGKSTLISLLQNIYPIHNGSLKIAGVDIRHIETDCLRQIVSVVPQKIDLFEGSIVENIALGEYAPDMNVIFEICKSIGILEFIEKLPQGFGTNIGENGVKLSGGQRQRLAIARALYRNPEILILDEATSSLDSESEMHIKRVLENLSKQGKTIITIAHRLGTVINADCIYVLSEGKLVETGNHDSLISMNGYYSRYWKAQTVSNS